MINWQPLNTKDPSTFPAEPGVYLVRTATGFGGLEISYETLYYARSCFRSGSLDQTDCVTDWAVIDEPTYRDEPTMYGDKLGRMVIVSGENVDKETPPGGG